MTILENRAAMVLLAAVHHLTEGKPGMSIRRDQLCWITSHDPAIVRATLDLLVATKMLCVGSREGSFMLSTAGVNCLRSWSTTASN